jgi:lipopolysaccharide/colanic/teichoic acid biosynthesis glycosyltransferase
MFSLLLVMADMLALMIGFAVGSAVHPVVDPWAELVTSLLATMLVYGVLAMHNQAYDARCLSSATCSCRSSALALSSSILIGFLIIFAIHATDSVSRAGIFAGLFCTGSTLMVQRVLIARHVRRHFSGRLFAELLIVDDCPIPDQIAGLTLIDARMAGLCADLDDPNMLHKLSALLRGFDRVIVACPPDRKIAWSQMLKGSNILGEIIAPDLDGIAPLSVAHWRGRPTLIVAREPLNLANRFTKRAMDLAITTPLLLLLLPLMASIAIAIKMDSPGPIFFRQQRIGRSNRLFQILKFRSMYHAQSDNAGRRSTDRGDIRVTRVGRLIRSTSMDELPQLINVLLGEMSLVGPRPHALGSTAEDMLFWMVDHQYWHRHALKPGITGLAQIRGFRGATATRYDVVNRVRADLEYMNQWSLLQDFTILIRTMMVLIHRNAY